MIILAYNATGFNYWRYVEQTTPYPCPGFSAILRTYRLILPNLAKFQPSRNRLIQPAIYSPTILTFLGTSFPSTFAA
jgi:hypothetical protein